MKLEPVIKRSQAQLNILKKKIFQKRKYYHNTTEFKVFKDEFNDSFNNIDSLKN